MHFFKYSEANSPFLAKMWLTPPPLAHSGSATAEKYPDAGHLFPQWSYIRYFRMAATRASIFILSTGVNPGLKEGGWCGGATPPQF